MSFTEILLTTLKVFVIVGLGGVTRRCGIINDDSERSIMRLVLMVLYPCFILWKVPGNASLQSPTNVALAMGVGFSLTVIGFGVAWGTGWLVGLKEKSALTTFCVAAGLQNYGFIPIPLIEEIFNADASEVLGVLFVHNLGLEVALWTIGVMLISGSLTGSLKRLINGPTIAIIVGLFLNFSGLYTYIPEFAYKAIRELGACSIPVSLLLVGASLVGVLQSEKWQTKPPVMIGSILVRFAWMPILFLTTAWLVGRMPALRNVLIVEAAMPSAIFPIVLARHFGGKPSVAVQVVLATSVACLALTPLWLLLGLWLFEIRL